MICAIRTYYMLRININNIIIIIIIIIRVVLQANCRCRSVNHQQVSARCAGSDRLQRRMPDNTHFRLVTTDFRFRLYVYG